jgi:hypothetical protein
VSGQKTWNEVGKGSVEILNADDRRQITCVLSVAASGHSLPMQIVYKGSTSRAMPKEEIRNVLQMKGHHITGNPKNHWSSEKTMEQFVERILLPYYEKVKKEMMLEESTKVIWLIDCWSVHLSEKFRSWMKTKHKEWLVFLYIPANCTSIFQPCNVSLNRPFKAAFRSEFQKWAIALSEQKFKEKDNTPFKMGAPMMKNESAL